MKPAAGTYTVVIDGYSVQAAGGTTYDYKDVYYSSALGTVKVDGSKPAALPNGGSAAVAAEVVVAGAAPEDASSSARCSSSTPAAPSRAPATS